MEYIIVKTKDNQDIMGIKLNENDRVIEIEDALIINHYYDARGYPIVYLSKYCLYNISFNISIAKSNIMQIFYDPLNSVIDHYESSIKRVKKNYNKIMSEEEYTTSDILDELISKNEIKH